MYRFRNSFKILIITLLFSFSYTKLHCQATCAAASLISSNGCGAALTTVTQCSTNAANPNSCLAPCTVNNMTTWATERWHRFVATASTATIIAAQSTAANPQRQLALIVYSGTCGAGLVQIGCSNSMTGNVVQTETVFLTGLTIGATYYIRVLNEGDGAGVAAFTSQVCISSAPNNDEPAGATTLPLGVSCAMTVTNSTQSTNTNCSPAIPDPVCATYTAGVSRDVWFKVNLPSAGNLVLQTQQASAPFYGMAVYSEVTPPGPGCGTLNYITCAEMGAYMNPPNMPAISLSSLSAGNYYIRMWTKTAITATTSTNFSICASSTTITPPANDNPCGAYPVTPSATSVCTAPSTTVGTIYGSTSSAQPEGCGTGGAEDDVWFSFVASSATHIIALSSFAAPAAGFPTDMYFSVFAGTCGALGSEILCNSTNNGVITGLTAGNTYYVRVFQQQAVPGYSVSFKFCVTTPSPPANDECSGAVVTGTNNAVSCATKVVGTVYGATASSEANGCAFGDDNDDVWYKFVAGSTSHSITITAAPPTTDFYHSIYAGVCGALGPAIMCSDPNTSLLYGLTVGNTYFIRIYSTSTAILNPGAEQFTLCINTPANNAGCITIPSATASPNYCASSNTLFISPSAYTYSSTIGSAPLSPNYTSDVPGNLGSVFCGSIEGNAWYPFIATNSTHVFPIESVAGCANGVQAQVFSVGMSGNCCNSFVSMSNCYNPGNTSSGTVTATGLTVGNTYWLMVDANGGAAACSYSILGWAPTSTLPIELISFTGKNQADVNFIEWSTASEANNDFFTVERSANGASFEKVVEVNAYGDGNSSFQQKYYTYDLKPDREITYYRLKQTDKKGQSKTSQIISVLGPDYYETITNLFPNPTSHDLNFEYTSKSKNYIEIELIAITGKTVLKLNQPLEEGKNNITLPMSELDNGVYILKVVSEKSGKTTHHKIIKN